MGVGVDETARLLRDPFGHERIPVDAGKATIALAPRGVRMFVVERATPARDPG